MVFDSFHSSFIAAIYVWRSHFMETSSEMISQSKHIN